jgi:WD repeat-containing protein 35
MAETIQPRLSAHQYLDGAEFELEIKQIVGDIFLCEDIGKSDKNSGSLLIVGKEGLMMVGSQKTENEEVLFHFIALQTREVFIRNLFSRIFVMLDTLKKIRQLIHQVCVYVCVCR